MNVKNCSFFTNREGLKHFEKGSLLLALFVLALILLNCLRAEAALYYVTACDNTSLGTNAYGPNGYNYVMKNPVITKLHVSSLYVYKNSYYMAEVGWCWHVGFASPNYFAAWKTNGYYYEKHFSLASPGTNHYYTVRNVSGTTKWRWYVDGVYQNLEVDLGFQKGISLVSSERNSGDETNYSHFWNLRKRDSAGNWYYWSNLQLREDNDPEYRLNKISNTECYVQTPN